MLALVGLIVGGLARLVLRGEESLGLAGTVLVGIGGSVLGGFVGRLLFGETTSLGSLVLAVAGAVVLVLPFRGRRNAIR